MNRRIPLELAGDDGGSMYVSERKVYPREVSGRLNTLRVAAVFWLLGMFYVFPWLRWDGRQAVLFDLPARKFHVFGLTFWPQDFLFLALLLIIAALALFFFTALAGRLFCGYACPQTVWTEVFLWMERWTEGERNKRMRLDAGPWTREKLLRKGAKHTLWVVFALWTGFTFVGFFTPITDLAARLPTLAWGGWETFWVLFYALATWGNAGFLREQVCKYMCPYARFQSAMFDRNTLIIAYDPMRGEPRGPRRRGLGSVAQRARGLLDQITAYDYVFRAALHPTAADNRVQAAGTITLGGIGEVAEPLPKFATEALGDCIDCTMCVQVCPTGIDIRNGLQYECIACGACIDACDDVMDKMGFERGLIRYSTQNAIDNKPTRVLRPRVLVYGALLLVLSVAWVAGVNMRSPLIVEVLRDRNALYRAVGGGEVENDYTIKLVNKTDQAGTYRIVIEGGAPGIELRGSGLDAVHAGPQQVISVPVIVVAPDSLKGRHSLTFRVETAAGDASETVDSSFFGPMP
ncbi:4Fe-4S dicluster domain-containing protein [Luteimonas sp. MC1828]|uniref:4Fe-4S dicluster domain-containing protein n=1 Tax=Luteimonas sp. MC1828 TaxID=2799787 RepID=UPI0018F1B330|nr:4Fe-4S dicluster domain-containing protein [Luteimonas sp. MC1828]MBJ7574154.1 4Fe-4S binding protein [Luteimonas sp. MC1828]